MVLLVVGGGKGTLKTARSSLEAVEGSTACPVVVVPEAKGAGHRIYEVVPTRRGGLGRDPKEVRAPRHQQSCCPSPREPRG